MLVLQQHLNAVGVQAQVGGNGQQEEKKQQPEIKRAMAPGAWNPAEDLQQVKGPEAGEGEKKKSWLLKGETSFFLVGCLGNGQVDFVGRSRLGDGTDRFG